MFSPRTGISDTESQQVMNGGGGGADPSLTVDGGVSENSPVVLPDVVRESDRRDEEELPGSGTTRSLLAQWRNMEQTVQNQGVTSTDHLRPKSQTQNRTWNTTNRSVPECSFIAGSLDSTLVSISKNSAILRERQQ